MKLAYSRSLSWWSIKYVDDLLWDTTVNMENILSFVITEPRHQILLVAAGPILKIKLYKYVKLQCNYLYPGTEL